MEFTDKERAILRRVQGALPDCATPFAAIADAVGGELGAPVSEDEVLELLRRLKEKGAIRRFGATLRHQKAGYSANAMVAWRGENKEEILMRGELLAAHPKVSHCYYRTPRPGWPYVLYSMVHGRRRTECLKIVEELCHELGVEVGSDAYAVLFSVKELKKTSMVYF